MKTNSLYSILFTTILSIGCGQTSETPKNENQTYSYVDSSRALGTGGADGVTACTLSGPEANVVIAKLVSTTWKDYVCGEEIPDARYRYKLDVLDDVFSDVSGELEILGLTNYEVLPSTAKVGDTFLLSYRKERNIKYLIQWVKLVEGESDTSDRRVTLPAKKNALFTAIRASNNKECNLSVFTDKTFISNWSRTDCGGDVQPDPDPEPEPADGNDL